MQGAPAQAAPGDPYVVYTANRQVGGSVVLRADPTTGAVSEVSRNGAQGRYFVHPYDLAVERDGSLLVVDMGAFAVDPRQRVADGAVIRVDPASGRQSLVSRGGALVDPAGIAVAPGGAVYVAENEGTDGEPGVIRIDPRTGAQTRVAEGGDLCNPFGLAVEEGGRPGGQRLRRPAERGWDPGHRLRVEHRLARTRSHRRPCAQPCSPSGTLFGSPFGVAVEPGGRILAVNEKAVDAGVVGVDPRSGYSRY